MDHKKYLELPYASRQRLVSFADAISRLDSDCWSIFSEMTEIPREKLENFRKNIEKAYDDESLNCW